MEISIASLAPTTFVPHWRGNRELPEAEQVKAEVRFPTVEEWEPYAAESVGKMDAIAVVKAFTTKIENLTIGEEKIETAADLVRQRKHVVGDLISELFLYIVAGTELQGDRSKN